MLITVIPSRYSFDSKQCCLTLPMDVVKQPLSVVTEANTHGHKRAWQTAAV